MTRPVIPQDRRTEDEQSDLLAEEGEFLGEGLLSVVSRVQGMVYLDPPENLASSVIEAVRLKRRPWWYRLSRWARARRSISFSPLQAMTVSAMLAVICVASILYLKAGIGEHLHRTQLQSGQNQGLVPVKLSLRLPEARSVAVAGSFNDWHPKECPMRKGERETWTAIIHLPAGRYEYAFIVDGQRIIPDPGASIHQDDGFGNQNAVLIVGSQDEMVI